MPKLKTNKSAQKRFRISKKGKVKYHKASKGHLLTLKSSKRRRNLNKAQYIEGSEKKTIKIILPYGA